jgi:DNA repair exonuclease SbcCD nuclease subunit
MPSDALVFVHLSDIHFSSQSGSPDDLEDDLRNQLLKDAPNVCKTYGGATAVLVSGDIAARGAEYEYEYARTWLDTLCGTLGIGTENVVTIPGNHDVDRNQQANDHVSRLARASLRATKGDTDLLDPAIAACHVDHGVRDALYRPLSNYNRFALQYAIDGEARWCREVYELNDTSKLVVWGVNSILVSDATDDLHASPLVVGTRALQLPEEDGTTHLLMCHHPPRWILDKVIDGPVAGRAKVQLFGHEHEPSVIRYRDSARVFAGALHPERRPNWQPQYNVIALRVDRSGDKRTLHVEVMARSWNQQAGHFVPDASKPDGKYEFDLELPGWERPVATEPALEVKVETDSGAKSPEQVPAMTTNPSPSESTSPAPERQLAHRFYRLSIPKQWGIVKQLGYQDLKDLNASTAAFFIAVFGRARNEKRLAELWKLVQHEYGENEAANPFDGR